MALTEVIVLIPEERVGDFYRLVGAWMTGGSLADEASTPRSRRRASGGGTPTLSSNSRYAPLHKHLADLKADLNEYEMSFEEISTVMGADLPKSARDHRAWWANTESHSQALAWISAGWKVDGVDLDNELIHFTRTDRAA